MSPCTSDADIRRFAMALRGQSPDEYNAEDNHTRDTAEKQIETALQVTGFVMGTPLPWNNKQADATGPWPSLFAVHPSVAVVVDREGDWWRRTGESWDFGSSWELFDKKTDVWRAFEISLRKTSCFAPFSTVEANMKRLVKQSSLGTEAARTARESVSPEHGRRIAEEAAKREGCSGVDIDDESALAERADDGTTTNPKIVTLCGSMKFFDKMLTIAAEETAKGHIVIAPFSVVAKEDQGSDFKKMLDELHFRKIDMADEIIVVTNENGYIGESTRREMVYAIQTGKFIGAESVRADPPTVVPVPNVTGPWPTLDQIPDNVEFRGTFSDADTRTETVWIKRDGVIWHSRPGRTHRETVRIGHLTPFVAAKADQ